MTTAELEQAYRQCHYCVEAPSGTLVLRVGRPSAALDHLLRNHGQVVATLISAANPFSRQLPAKENAIRHQSLLARLSTGHGVLPAVARDPRGAWPDEHGLLVPGLHRSMALDIARAFNQHAILWCEAGRPVELLWTGADPSPGSSHLDEHGADDRGKA